MQLNRLRYNTSECTSNLSWSITMNNHISLQLYKEIFENIKEGIVITDSSASILTVNKAFQEITGYTEEDLLGKNPNILHSQYHDSSFDAGLWKQIHQEGFWQGEILNKKKNGTLYWQTLNIYKISDVQSDFLYVGCIYDITDFTKQKEQLNDNIEKLELILQNLDIVLWSVDVLNNQLLYISPSCEKLYGYPPDFFSERNSWNTVIHPDDRKRVLQNQAKLYKDRVLHHEYRIILPNGQVKWVIDHTIAIFDVHHNLIQLNGVVEDITKRKTAEDRIYQLAYYDELTGLPNQRLFQESLSQALQQVESVAVILFDINRLKQLNDSFGSPFGDKVIQAVSEYTENLIKTNKGTLARIRGDEFAILLPEIKPEQAIEIAESILHATNENLFVEGHLFPVSCTVGISFYPTDGKDADTLLEKSKMALHHANKTGNDIETYSYSMEQEKRERIVIETGLYEALILGEFELYYQPQIDIRSNQIAGVEALIRWNKGDNGMISPAQFIPVAEQNGLINPIGDWVLRKAFQQYEDWQRAGMSPINLSVNLSTRQFLQLDLKDKLLQLLRKIRINPANLTLEITESMTMNVDRTLSVLHQLRKIGVQLAIDDFGTGYSSLSYLSKMPINELKIDKSFVQEMLDKKTNNDSIVKSIISMAHHLRLRVVAEGVETKEQLHFLQENECDFIQGYLACKPMPGDEFFKYYMQSRKGIVNQG